MNGLTRVILMIAAFFSVKYIGFFYTMLIWFIIDWRQFDSQDEKERFKEATGQWP